MYKIEAKDSDNKVSNLEYVDPEIWKPVDEHEGYEVSNKGRVRSWHKPRNLDGWRDRPKMLKQCNSNGYKVVGLSPNNTQRKVHRLIAKAFIPNPNNYPYVLHKNDIGDDNRIENLYWGTPQQNMDDRRSNSSYNEGELCNRSKLTENEVLEMRAAYDLGVFTYEEIGEAYGVSKHSSWCAITGKSWSHI